MSLSSTRWHAARSAPQRRCTCSNFKCKPGITDGAAVYIDLPFPHRLPIQPTAMPSTNPAPTAMPTALSG